MTSLQLRPAERCEALSRHAQTAAHGRLVRTAAAAQTRAQTDGRAGRRRPDQRLARLAPEDASPDDCDEMHLPFLTRAPERSTTGFVRSVGAIRHPNFGRW
jgi:hypothetical protein